MALGILKLQSRQVYGDCVHLNCSELDIRHKANSLYPELFTVEVISNPISIDYVM